MKNFPWLLRVYGERRGNQWSIICLDFNLAAQDESLDGAQKKLHSMILTYLKDALSEDGVDRQYASYFLRRRAPLVFWAKYYLAVARTHLGGPRGGQRGKRVARSETIPMVPAGA